MLDRLTSMAAFVKAVDTGSFTAAARALGLSQQMVAKHVASLEDRLGLRLLNRTTRSQSLTEAGRVYCERCRSVLAEAEAADALTVDVKGEPRGRLRLTAPLLFGRTRLMPMVGAFLRRHRNVEVDVVLTDRVVDLVEEGFEAAFRIGELADSTLIARRLASMSYVVCASPAYLAACGAPSSPADLAGHDCLSYAARLRPTDAVWDLSRDGRVEQVRVTGRLHVDDTQALLAAALDGIGILRAPEPVVRDALASGQLARVLPDHASPALPLHLLYPPDRRQTPKLRRFVEESVRAFG